MKKIGIKDIDFPPPDVSIVAKKHVSKIKMDVSRIIEAARQDVEEGKLKYRERDEYYQKGEEFNENHLKFFKDCYKQACQKYKIVQAQSSAPYTEEENAERWKNDVEKARQEAYARIEKVRQKELEPGNASFTPENFRCMSEHVFKYDEAGNKIKKENDENDRQSEDSAQDRRSFSSFKDLRQKRLISTGETFDSGEEMKGKYLDEIIREQMQGILKTKGNLSAMCGKDWVQGVKQKGMIQYCCSQKLLFYYLLECSPQIENLLVEKYTSNPMNPLMFVQYKQTTPNFINLSRPDPSIIRKINLKQAFSKFKDEIPSCNLLCIGEPQTGKSGFLNKMLEVNFDMKHKDSFNMFHDSVDLICDSPELPMKFNVYDFHDKLANYDWQLIKVMFERLPNCYLFVQVTGIDYYQELVEKLGSELIADRVFVLLKHYQQRVASNKVHHDFNIGEEWFFDIKDEQGGGTFDYMKAKVLEKLQQALQVNQPIDSNEEVRNQKKSEQKKVANEKFSQKKNQLAQEMRNEIEKRKEYDGIFGPYWYLEDAFDKDLPSANFKVSKIKEAFRSEHLVIKKFLQNFASEEENYSLTRQEVFPLYMKTLQLKKIELELKQIKTKAQEQRLIEDKTNLKREMRQLEKNQPHDLFKKFYETFIGKDSEKINDLLNLVEACYKPRLSKVQQQIEELERKELKFENDSAELNILKKQLVEERAKVQDYVLDKELFIRECKLYVKRPDIAKVNEFAEAMAYHMRDGNAIEIIDGDIDTLDKDSLQSMMHWVQTLHGDAASSGNQLVVITILGPQSSGKSTLLNYLMGAKFHVSAGRCTKGLNAMLLRTDVKDAQDILILDSEGLFSIERQDPKYDRRLAIFCFAVSNFLLINIKGELNTQVKEVLEVSIYALQKLKDIAADMSSARPHFICRDMNNGSTKDIKGQFEKIKAGLEEAATAAGTTLSDLITMTSIQAEDMMDTFHGAIEKKTVGTNSVYVQTKSNEKFREQCSVLRQRIIEFAQGLTKDQRKLNLEGLISHMSNVWTALTEADDLVMIRDLKSINDQRVLIKAIEDFYKIMSNYKSDSVKEEQNPLMKGRAQKKNLEEYIKIAANGRITSELVQSEDQGVAKLQKLKDSLTEAHKGTTEQGTEPEINDDEIDQIDKEVMENIEKVSKKWKGDENTTGLALQMVDYFGTDMSDDLCTRGKYIMNKNLEKIIKKGIKNWKKESVKFITGFKISRLENYVKTALWQKASDDPGQFNEMLRKEIDKTKAGLDADLLSDEKIDEQCKDKVRSYATKNNHGSLSEECKDKINVPRTDAPCLQFGYSLFEDGVGPQTMEFLQDPQIEKLENEHLQSLDINSLDNAFKSYKEEDDDEKNEREELSRVDYPKMKSYAEEQNVKQLKEFQEKLHKEVLFKHKSENEKQKNTRKIPAVVLDKLREAFETQIKQGAVNRKKMNDIVNQLKPKNYWKDERGKTLAVLCINTKALDYFDACERFFIKLQREQYHRNRTILSKNNASELDLTKEKMNIFFRNQVDSKGGLNGQVNKLVIQFMERAQTLIKGGVMKELQQKLDSMQGKFTKKENSAKARTRFINTESEAEIIQHMKKPVEFEEAIFEEDYQKMVKQYELECKQAYRDETAHVAKQLRIQIVDLRSFFNTNLTEADEITSDQRKHVLGYLYYLIFESQMSHHGNDQVKSGCEKLKSDALALDLQALFTAEAAADHSYKLPEVKQKIFTKEDIDQLDMLDLNRWNEDQKAIQEISDQWEQGISMAQFLKLFDGTIAEYENLTEGESIPRNFTDQESIFIKGLEQNLEQLGNKDDIKKSVIGCRGECPFCGARCDYTEKCKKDEAQNEHRTPYHRPMAFKGACEKYDNKKYLCDDHCFSDYNLKKSVWPDDSVTLEGKFEELERHNPSVQLQGINLVLEWNSESDLDIHAMCGCGTWTDSPYYIECPECDMARDVDSRTGKAGRIAQEHIYFADPKKLIGKNIGTYVENHLPQGEEDEDEDVTFKLYAINRYQVVIWPKPLVTKVEHEKWMSVKFESGAQSESQEFTYTQEMDEMGVIGFEAKLLQLATKAGAEDACGWKIDEANAAEAKNDPDYQAYKKSWQLQWQKVKTIICGRDHFDCEQLDSLQDNKQEKVEN